MLDSFLAQPSIRMSGSISDLPVEAHLQLRDALKPGPDISPYAREEGLCTDSPCSAESPLGDACPLEPFEGGTAAYSYE
jgi:hypothetical protein